MKISDYSQWQKLDVAPLGVDPTIFAPRPDLQPRQRFELIVVCSLAPVKGLHILIDAMHRLIQQKRPVLLRIVGDGPDRTSIEEHIRSLGMTDSIRMEGALNQDQVRDLYKQSDIFALPTFAEGVPVVLMEAMAMEIPCATTWITGIPELIRNEVDGLLAPASDADQFAAAVARLMDDRELRVRLGRSGRQRVQEKYDLARNTRLFAEIMARRLGGAATAGD
jgi:glycosyltransferase involved in cell wall biosynthesis